MPTLTADPAGVRTPGPVHIGKRQDNENIFPLIELLVVIAIIALLMAMLMEGPSSYLR